ncbi:RES family NAD+ phosphorylase [Sneathiella aquimaris]|uniref:RES family NAD+ phosphorylase n=1 Tax=Sneathiella aquimaris TaxID=2599305 RepID=UPI00146ECDBF|nr:RES family NAD+ phosphorylase [Sneathiella aquimaris]
MTYLCPHCFGDEGLKKRIVEIRPSFPNEKCSFHPTFKGIPAKDVADIIDEVFRNYYEVGEWNSYRGEQEGDTLYGCIATLTEVEDDEIAMSLARELEENQNYYDGDSFYADDQVYSECQPNLDHHSYLWQLFCKSILHGQRFFNASAKSLIAEIFEGIHFQSNDSQQSPIYEIKPGDPQGEFYRARIADEQTAQSKIASNPATELGPPPEKLRTAGRMNPSGITCFYGAYNIATCNAELRPDVGSTVLGAKFELARPIHVLDTTRFQAPIKHISLFSKNHLIRLQQWIFMQDFRREIAKPISKYEEHLGYIPTQAVAEYLLHHHMFKRNGKDAKIEAIIFQSAQYSAGRNIVLLGEAACVKNPANSISKKQKKLGSSSYFPDFIETFLQDTSESKTPGLRVVSNSLEAHRVISAEFASSIIGDQDLDAEDSDF